MKQIGTFSIDNGTPIVIAYELLEPKIEDYRNYSDGKVFIEESYYEDDVKEYKSSRREWELDNLEAIYLYEIDKGQQVEFEEMEPPSDKRGKCKIIKII